MEKLSARMLVRSYNLNDKVLEALLELYVSIETTFGNFTRLPGPSTEAFYQAKQVLSEEGFNITRLEDGVNVERIE